MKIKNGSLFLFRFLGVNVYLHWSWAVVAVIQIYLRQRGSTQIFGNSGVAYHVCLYLSLFAIVLIHEFGHALACKSVGGRAEQIMLWPLGGVAYVAPPQRPGAYLWSIFAGPLVNIILVPLTVVPAYFARHAMPHTIPANFLMDLAFINASLLVFNMLPFYPLDGGQIVRGLLWFIAGRGLSLVIATILGIVGAVLLGIVAYLIGGIYLGVMVLFMGMSSIRSLQSALALYRLETAPRHEDATCPHCQQHPPAAPAWGCPCGMRFDTFQTLAQCPNCGTQFPQTMCLFCHQFSPLPHWYPPIPSAAEVTAPPEGTFG